jgi:hypothetical protein
MICGSTSSSWRQAMLLLLLRQLPQLLLLLQQLPQLLLLLRQLPQLLLLPRQLSQLLLLRQLSQLLLLLRQLPQLLLRRPANNQHCSKGLVSNSSGALQVLLPTLSLPRCRRCCSWCAS